MNKIIEQIEFALEQYDHNYDRSEICALVDRWSSNKSELIRILSHHPQWNDDAKAIILDVEDNRDIEEYVVRDCMDTLYRYLSSKGLTNKDDNVFLFRQLEYFRNNITPKVTEEVKNNLDSPYYGNLSLTVGTKISRVLNKIYTSIGINNDSEQTVCALNVLEDYVYGSLIGSVDGIIKNDNRYSVKGSPAKITNIINNVVTVLKNFAEMNSDISYTTNTLVEEIKDRMPCYNKVFAKLSDALNPMVIKRKMVISVHPCDFLTMSRGTGWQSCHNIQDGCYMAGTLSYMTDASSMIVYTVNEDYDGDKYWWQEKIIRNVFCYQNDKLLQSRMYPTNNENKKSLFREIVQRVFADAMEVPNFWTLTKNFSDVLNHFQTHYRSHHYPDYDYSEYRANVSILKDSVNRGVIAIGSKSFCLSCGDELDESGALTCDHCVGHTCYDCGHDICDEEIIWVNGTAYCSDCAYVCVHCGEGHRGQGTYIDGVGDVCEYCRDRRYSYCEQCDEWYDGESYYVNDFGSVCENCIDEFYYCDECGEYFNSPLTEVADNGYYVCNHCLNHNYTQCSECSEYFLDENVIEVNGHCVCNKCYEEMAEVSEESMATSVA